MELTGRWARRPRAGTARATRRSRAGFWICGAARLFAFRDEERGEFRPRRSMPGWEYIGSRGPVRHSEGAGNRCCAPAVTKRSTPLADAVMKETRGQAKPKLVNELLRKKLRE